MFIHKEYYFNFKNETENFSIEQSINLVSSNFQNWEMCLIFSMDSLALFSSFSTWSSKMSLDVFKMLSLFL